jgi:hypothetical protein
VCAAACGLNETLCSPDGGAPYCAITWTDNANCGACGNACPQGKVCTNGVCSANCAQGQTFCAPDGGAPYCASTQTDNSNCGTCGNACGQGLVCASGSCSANCAQGQTFCTPDGGAPYCASTQTDNANCGTCGNVCPQGQVCSAGTCAVKCSVNLTQCGNQCIDVQTDLSHCGGCNKPCNGTCTAGVCTGGACVPSGSRVAFNTMTARTTTGCWTGNPCQTDVFNWSATYGENFQALGQSVTCGGTTGCVAHAGITTYNSFPVCQGAWDVYCDASLVGNINTNGKACQGSAMANGCSITFGARTCTTIRLAATAGSGQLSCCGGTSPDSMITAVSAW